MVAYLPPSLDNLAKGDFSMHHLAIDIGASSGRILHGFLAQEKIVINEIHRFPNRFHEENGHLFWQIDALFEEILKGLQIAKQQGIEACTIGIDTWAVDYVLLDELGQRMQPVYAYRDERTAHTMEKVFTQLSKETIYEKTGIQFMSFNTIFQLFEEENKNAATVFLIPDYLNYLLTGNKTFEITNASTTQLLNVHTRQLDADLLQLVGLSEAQFPAFIEPGTMIGQLKSELYPMYDLPDATVIAVASHDTASAVLGTPAIYENWAYLSSGTWSLVGVENKRSIVSTESLYENYTNEVGAFQTYRFLKNIMGLWVIQEVQRLLPDKLSFSELSELAKKVPTHQQFINLNDVRFLNPANMIEEIQQYCEETNQPIPRTAGELAAAVYHNLAILIAFHLDHIEEINEQKIDYLHIVGGGAHNEFLNTCIATYSQRTVFAGPTEATAIGNLLIQLLYSNEIHSLEEGRQFIHQSFPIKKLTPAPFNKEALFEKFLHTTTYKSEESL